MSDGKVEYEVRATYDKIDSDMDKANGKIEKSTSKWSGIAQGAAMKVGGMLVDVGVKVAQAAWEMGTAFEDGLAKASTLIDTTKVDMDAFGDSLLDLSSKYGLEAAGLTESAYNAISANNALAEDTAGLMGLLESSAKLAKAGFTDVDTATSATLKTLNAYGLGVEEADRIQKVLIQTQNTGITTVGELGAVLSNVTPTAAAMGVSFENVGAAIATMTAQGTPAAQATTQLNSLMAELGKSGTMAAENLSKAAEGSKYAGMSFQEMTAAGVPLNEILTMMEEYAAANNLTMLDMFSSIEAGKAALSMTGQGAQAFTSNLAAMSTQTDVVGEGFDKVSGTNAEKFNRAMTTAKNIVITLYQAMSPLISGMLDFANVILDKVGAAVTWVSGILEGWATILGDVWHALGNFLGGNSGKKSGARSHAVGLDRVPYNDYPAILHQGETVLKPAEAAVYRAGGNARAGMMEAAQGEKFDYGKMARAMSGMAVMMDKEKVGVLVEPVVSSRQARRVESTRRSGFNGQL